MRRAIMVVAIVGGLAGCGFFRKTMGVGDTAPAHTPPTTTSIFGDWVLATSPDSTAFVGANRVEMNLQQTSFTITANYPSRGPVIVRGSVAQAAEGGLLTLTPQSGLEGTNRGNFGWSSGEPFTVVASAAGNTLLFAPPRDNVARPSSTWHRKDAAARAGTAPPPAS